jgi:CRISPR-associated protein Csx10
VKVYQLRYEIETLSPAILTQISGDMNMVSTLDYIPGTVVQGVFAKKYIKTKNLPIEAHEDQVFYEWFLNSCIIFTNAYIVDDKRGKKAYFFPTPFSIHEYKISKEEHEKKNAFDLMVKLVKEKQTRHISDYCRIESREYCQIQSKDVFTKNVKKSINFHHARENRLRGHSEEGTIFNYESLDSGQTFAGRIIGNENELKRIKALFENQGKIRIGRSKNTQYGDAKLTWISSQPEKYDSEVQGFTPDQLNGDKFTLTFLSSAIIYNKYGFASTSISDLRRCLEESINLPTGSFEILKSFKRTEIVENFVGKWLLKKPSEDSIKAGSCFEIKLNNPDQFNNDVKQSLLELQKTGIGERTGQGFGRFVINLQKMDKYELHKPENEKKKKEERKGKIKKPNEEIPELTKEIIKNVILNSYNTRIEAKALKDCSGFLQNKERIPPNSLIGKIELMLRDSDSKDSDSKDSDSKDSDSKDSDPFEIFMKKVESFPQLTRNKLDRCRNEDTKETLFYLIVPTPNNTTNKQTAYNSKKEKIFTDLIIDNDVNEACNLISFYPDKDPDSKFKLYSHYWLTFLAKMRKEKKRVKSQEKGGKNNGSN